MTVGRPVLLLAAFWVLALQPVLHVLAPSIAVLAPLDWSGHLATTVLVLANVPVRLRRPVIVTVLATVVLLDLDHAPQYLGTDVLTEGTPRPYPHSLATVVVLGTAAALLPRPSRTIAAAAAIGVLLHLLRDVATGPGVALLWPLSEAAVRVPYWVEAALVGALAARAWTVGGRSATAREPPRPVPPRAAR